MSLYISLFNDFYHSCRPQSLSGTSLGSNKIKNILHKSWLRLPDKSRPKSEYKLDSSAQLMLQEYLDELTKFVLATLCTVVLFIVIYYSAIIEQSRIVATHRKSDTIDTADVSIILGKTKVIVEQIQLIVSLYS